MTRATLMLLSAICVALAGLMAASASASEVQIGPDVSTTPPKHFTMTSEVTLIQAINPEAGVAVAAPADGVVTSWKVFGEGKIRLRVLRPSGEAFSGAGTSNAVQGIQVEGLPNPTSLPIQAGDVIGLDINAPAKFGFENVTNSRNVAFMPPLPDGGTPQTSFNEAPEVLALNATVALRPVLTGLAPTTGSTAGGTAVKLVGKYLDGTTGVSFGSVAATSFTVESPNQITAIAPAMAVSAVDVRVTGAGGTSAVSTADLFTFAVPAPPASTPVNPISSLTAGAKPTVSGLGQTTSRWRRGGAQAKLSRVRAPVGTTFSFTLSNAATVRLAFTQRRTGRKVRGVCKAPSPSNSGKRKCTRPVLGGMLSLPARSGLNELRFQGRLPGGKSLKIGDYTLALTARDAQGLQSAARSLSFTIVG